MTEKKHYYGIDWLRVIACLGIVMMHVQANSAYELFGPAADKVILFFTDFVFLFMTISAFGMCAGYYEEVNTGNVNWVKFYKKKILKGTAIFCCSHFS